jgi:hypothetical protein
MSVRTLPSLAALVVLALACQADRDPHGLFQRSLEVAEGLAKADPHSAMRSAPCAALT